MIRRWLRSLFQRGQSQEKPNKVESPAPREDPRRYDDWEDLGFFDGR